MTATIPFSRQNRDLTKLRRRRRRRRQKAIGVVSKTTTLHVHYAFLYISLPSLHDYDVKWPNCKVFWGREWQGYKFDHLCLNSGATPSLQLQLNLFNFRTMLWAHYNSCSLIIRPPLLDKIPMKVKFFNVIWLLVQYASTATKKNLHSRILCCLHIEYKQINCIVCLFVCFSSEVAPGEWTDDTIKLCLYLYLALLPQNHKLFHE